VGSQRVVLLVDDDEDSRSAIGEVLTSEGFTVSYAGHGREALELIEIGPMPDLILLDWIMPEMGGAELLAILDRSPATRAIPLIVLTALPRVASPGRRVVRKPVYLEELVWTVVEMCPPLWADGEAPTDEVAVPPSMFPSRLPEETAREHCRRCGARAASRCHGCGEAYCEGCFDGIGEPGARCARCRMRSTGPTS